MRSKRALWLGTRRGNFNNEFEAIYGVSRAYEQTVGWFDGVYKTYDCWWDRFILMIIKKVFSDGTYDKLGGSGLFGHGGGEIEQVLVNWKFWFLIS